MPKEKIVHPYPLEYYLSLKYPYTLDHIEEENEYVVNYEDFGRNSGNYILTGAETEEEAHFNAKEALELAITVAYEQGDPIPLPGSTRSKTE